MCRFHLRTLLRFAILNGVIGFVKRDLVWSFFSLYCQKVSMSFVVLILILINWRLLCVGLEITTNARPCMWLPHSLSAITLSPRLDEYLIYNWQSNNYRLVTIKCVRQTELIFVSSEFSSWRNCVEEHLKGLNKIF